ncbi:MAG TPA: ATP synthase subunit I [Bryobacteraceae bacterium]|nr:ATP synthase subunit I [Bryobacteraceae bacterium]
MTAGNGQFYERALARIPRFMGLLALAGVLVTLLWKGWRAAAGFAFGSFLSWINFRLLKRIADSIGAAGSGPSVAGAVFFGSRYLILGMLAYVILKLTNISLPAALAGLFLPLGAVLAEIVFEIIYARD